MPERDDESFLLRWSRRKRTAGRDESGKVAAAEPAQDASRSETTGTALNPSSEVVERPHGESEQPAEADQVPDDLAGVEVEALGYEADFTRFMRDDVPDALKKRALRQLWRSDPILANVDGLNDYDDDFSDAALAVKVLETAHKVGRGYLDGDDEPGADEAVTDEEAATATTGEPEAAPESTDVASPEDVEAKVVHSENKGRDDAHSASEAEVAPDTAKS